ANDRIDHLLVLDNARQDGAKPLWIGLTVVLAVEFLAQPECLVFGRRLQHAAAGQIHLVQRLDGCEAGRTPLVGNAPFRLALAGIGQGHAPSFFRSAIMVRAARAANPPLSPSLLRARAQACSSFSTVRMPLPIATDSSTARSIRARLDSLATISKW